MPNMKKSDAISLHAFQSAPGREAGRCDRRRILQTEKFSFNPRPAVRPGDALHLELWERHGKRFNPRPAVRPGDAGCRKARRRSARVSIRARP